MNNAFNNIKNETKNKKIYKCVFHNPLLNNDITSAIDIDNNYLAYGTIMGDVNFCIIDEFYFYKRKNSNDSNRTNANITIDDEIKKNKNDIKEIKLIKNNEYITKNKFKYKSPFKHIKKMNKNIKIFLNKEPDPEENQKTEELGSDNFNDKIKTSKIFKDKFINSSNKNIRIKKLYHSLTENISCISLVNDNLNFSVGDYQLIHCEKISSFIGKDIKNAYNYKQINNYITDKEHSEFCETAQCFLTKKNYLIVFSFYSDFNWPLKFNQVKYENKNLFNFEVIKGSIYMSNYNVPFDFDGDNFLYLEYLSKTMRSINIYSTLKGQKLFQFFIKNEFGHISFMKLIPDDCIFLCRKIYICEIYKIRNNSNYNNNNNNVNNNENKDFVLLKNWVHIEDKEIIACNVYIIENQIKEDNNETKYNFNHAKIKKEREKQNNINTKNEIHSLKLIEGENSYDSYTASHNKILNYDKSSNNFDSNTYYKNIENIIKIEKTKNECIKVNSNKLTNNNNIYIGKNKYYIITLDIEGNFNIYYYNIERKEETKNTLFNLYQIYNIEKKYKDAKFFSLGFPYYITMNDYYYVITTDNGIFVINNETEEN